MAAALEGLVVVHVDRTPEVYASEHIPGARFLSSGELALEREGVPGYLPSIEALTAIAMVS